MAHKAELEDTTNADHLTHTLADFLDTLRSAAVEAPADAGPALRRGAQALLDMATAIDSGAGAGRLRANADVAPRGATETDSPRAPPDELTHLSNRLNDAILFVSGPEAHIAGANDRALEMYGYAREELLAKTIYDLRSPKLHSEVERHLAEARTRGFVFESVHVRKDGTEFPVEVSAQADRAGHEGVIVSVVRDITARREAHRTTLEGAANLRSLYDAMMEGVALHELVLDAAGTPVDYVLLDVNRAYEAILNLSAHVVIGRRATEVYGTTEAPYLDVYARVALTGNPTWFEVPFAPMNKTFAISVFSPGKNRFATVFEDITDKRTRERVTQDLVQRLQFALRAGRLGVWDWDLQANTMVWDDEMLSLYGLSRPQFPGGVEAWEQGLHPEDRQRALAECQAALNGTHEYDTEFRIIQPNGAVKYVKADALVLRDPDGAPVRMLGLNRDITAQKVAESALRESEAWFRAIFDNSPVPIGGSRAGRTVLANRAYVELFGFADPKEIVGRPITDQLTAESSVVAFGHHMARLAGKPAPDEYEAVGVRSDGGTFPFSVNTVRMDLPGGPTALGFFRDLSGVRAAERERATLVDQLHRAQKLEALGTLAGGIAHDFNNILSPILANSELVLDTLPRSDPSYELVSDIFSSSIRARDLTRQILTFGRRQEHRYAPCALGPTVADALRLLRAALPPHIQIGFDASADVPLVLADPSQIHQVVTNLITNAAHALPIAGGSIEVTVRTENGDDVIRRQHLNLNPGRYVVVGVADNGHGMSEETLARVFEPFFTTKPVGEGTGLGLAVVHGIVTEHGGGIVVDSTVGQGTTVRVYFPELESPVERKPPESTQPAPAVGQGRRILVVDDEELLVLSITRVLVGFGFVVTGLTDPTAALALLTKDAAQVDSVVIDMAMPGMSGIDLAAAITRLCPGLPIVLTTGNAGRIDPARARQCGVSEVLSKPFRVQDLIQAVARASDRGKVTERTP